MTTFNIKSKVWLEREGDLVFGEGKVRILEAVQREGSLNKAAESLGMSFRHAWGYISAVEKRLGTKLLDKKKGGKDKGGSILTNEALELINKFQKLNQDVKEFSDKKYEEIFCNGNS